jgi:regulatory protein
VPIVTALREDRRGRVSVELDGVPWRVVPTDVVVRAELAEGRELDRPTLRVLRRELRRAEALAVAARALRPRDLSEQCLEERLTRAAVAPAARAEALATLSRAGLVDDLRYAQGRSQALAARGYGDEAIAADLDRNGVSREVALEALAGLALETERAQEIVDRRGPGGRTARFLAARGFGEEAVEAALGAGFANDP